MNAKGRTVSLSVDSDELPLYVADGPPDGPGVVVIQEYWGVNQQIMGVADRLAAEGFTAAVPDLYGKDTTEDRDTALSLMLDLDVDWAQLALEATFRWLRADEGCNAVGCVGFCMGGGLALLLAAGSEESDATVVFYGAIPWAGRGLSWERAPAPLLLHYASEDEWATPSLGREAASGAASAGGHAEFFEYDGAQHAFLDETRAESHDPAAAAAAWTRTIDFLHATLSACSRTSSIKES